jgi:hypothetical protein
VITRIKAMECNYRTDEGTEDTRAFMQDKLEVIVTGEQQNVNYFNSSSLVRICASIVV